MFSQAQSVFKAQHATTTKVSSGLFALRYTPRTIVFADVVGSTRLLQVDEFTSAGRIRALLLEFAEQIVPRYEGQCLQRLGDGLMLEFANPRSAVECSRALHQRAAEASADRATEERILLHIGINSDEVLTDDVAYYGRGIHLAARLGQLAAAGETFVSPSVQQQLACGLDGEFEDMGILEYKAGEPRVRAFRVRSSGLDRTALAPPNPGPALRTTLAVIPFDCYGACHKQQAVGEVLADDLIATLSQIPELRLISRMSTTRFRGRELDLHDIESYLRATYVLHGRYEVKGRKLVVRAQLADVRTGEVIRTTSANGSAGNTLAGCREIVTSLASAVTSAIMQKEVEQIRMQYLPTLEGYTLLLGGTALMLRPDRSAFDQARRVFEHLIARFPRHAQPYARLAQWHVSSVTQGWFSDLDEVKEVAKSLAARALDIDPSDSYSLTVDGLVHTNLLRSMDQGLESYDRALTANPSEGLAWLRRGTLFAFQGRADESQADIDQALALSPLDPWKFYYDSLSATAALAAKDYDRALRLARQSLRLNRLHASTWRVLAIAAAETDRMEEARAAVLAIRELDPALTVSSYLRRSASNGFETGKIWSAALQRAGLPA